MNDMAPSYRRNDELLWRDTGEHVLVLLPDTDSEVTVLGGGGAELWRLLDEPAGLDQLVERFTGAGTSHVDQQQVADCLSQLTERGILVAGSVPV